MKPAETRGEFLELCRAWDNDALQFTHLVADGIRLLYASEAELARELKTRAEIVRRWANGFAHPALSAQRNVINTFLKRALSFEMLETISTEEVREWLEEGKKRGASHMLLVCDVRHKEIIHPYVRAGEKADTACKLYQGEETLYVAAVYSLREEFGPQIAEQRPWRFSD